MLLQVASKVLSKPLDLSVLQVISASRASAMISLSLEVLTYFSLAKSSIFTDSAIANPWAH